MKEFSCLPFLDNSSLEIKGLGLKNRQVGGKWVSDDYSYLYKGFLIYNYKNEIIYFRFTSS
jgi:hypothetical protein